MTPRERMLAALDFAGPDRMPVVYHPSTAGLYVHGERLLELFQQFPPDNPITFDHIPQPPASGIGRDGSYYEEITDGWGIRWGYHTFGIQGQPVAYPFDSWVAAADYALPALPTAEQSMVPTATREEFLIIQGWACMFQQLYALRPMEDVLVGLALGDKGLLAFLDRLATYSKECVELHLARGVDVIMFADDWGAQGGPLVSPETFRDYFRPHYEEMFARVHAGGARVFFHCCGKMGYILDELIDLGIDGLWHQSALYDTDAFAERCREAGVTVYIHPDRQHLIPLGSPAEVRATVKRFADRHHRLGGGGIFYVEMENDVPFENAKALIESIHEYR